jgi:outer membrane protein OmpA-like peptidoglycan-associated protein
MRASLLLVAVLALLIPTVSFAQSAVSSSLDTPASSQSDKDVDGRPLDNASVPQVALPTPSEQTAVDQQLKDIYFDFNRADLRPDERATLESDAAWLKSHPGVFITIEGDADERGDIVYNVALSDYRALTTRDALVAMGVEEDRVVFATGWGKLYPVCSESDEICWSHNRRAHFELWGESGQTQATLQPVEISQP